MIWTVVGAIFSFALPAFGGWMIVSTTWPCGPKILRASLGTGLGLGVAGMLWMLGLLISGSAMAGLAASDGVLITLTALLWTRRARIERRVVAPPPGRFSKLQIGAAAGIVLTLLFAAASLGLMAYISHHGDFDAFAIWNTRARFFYLAAKPLDLLPDLTSPDYPLLLPSLVARGWQYSHQDTVIIPLSLAVFFTAGSIVLLCGLRSVTSSSAAPLAGAILAGTPFFIMQGMSQYADIVMCFFITSAVTVFCVSDFAGEGESGYLPLLSGLFAGFAACTKNEGTLVVVSMIAARSCMILWNRRWKIEGIRMGLFLAGLAPGFLALTVFRRVAPVPSVLFANITAATIRTRIIDGARHSSILAGYWRDLLHFGNWWINPLVLLLLYVVIRRGLKSAPRFTTAWRFPGLLVVIMLCGYYFVYLFSPYAVVWHVQSSFSRLLVQLWPSALLFWAFLVTPEAQVDAS